MSNSDSHKYHVMRRTGEGYERVYSGDRADVANAKVKAYGKDRCERWNKVEYVDWLKAQQGIGFQSPLQLARKIEEREFSDLRSAQKRERIGDIF